MKKNKSLDNIIIDLKERAKELVVFMRYKNY